MLRGILYEMYLNTFGNIIVHIFVNSHSHWFIEYVALNKCISTEWRCGAQHKGVCVLLKARYSQH